MFGNKLTRFTLALAGCTIGLGLGITGCGHRGQQAPAMPGRPPAMVAVTDVITQDVPIYLDQIGRTVSIENVTIVPQVSGKVTSVNFKDGAYVKKGDLLFEIDPRPFQATLDEAKAQLSQNKAILELARDELKRYSDAVASAAVSEMEFKQKSNAVATAQARVDAAAATVETAQLNLEYSRIYSPIDGRTGARLIDPGNVVTANVSQLLVIQRLDPIYAEFTVTENDFGSVKQHLPTASLDSADQAQGGLKVLVDVPADSARMLIALGAGPQTQPAGVGSTAREGKLTFLDNRVHSETGTVMLRATLPNQDHHFWPGQFVNVRLVLTTKKNATLIPAEAQQLGQQGPYVYVVTADQSAQLRPIVPGQRQGPLLVVQQGLQAGDRVVVSGHGMVMPGAKVMVMNPPDQPGQGGPGGPPQVSMVKEKQ